MTKFCSSTIGEFYRVEKCIGRGTFSSVFEIRRLIDDRKFALKKVFIADIKDEKARSDCLNEVNLLQKIEHQHIIRFVQCEYDHGEEPLNVVLELAEAGDLNNFILNHVHNLSLILESKIWKFTCQLCMALDYLHSKCIIHNDLKPANIFLTLTEDIKIGDFGMAEVRSSFMKEQSISVLGTPYYMSPERLLQKPYSFNCDVWSLGCVMYEVNRFQLAALQCPFYVSKLDINLLIKRVVKCDYPPIPSDVFSKELNNTVSKCLNANEDKRPNAKQILDIAQHMRKLFTKSVLRENSSIQGK